MRKMSFLEKARLKLRRRKPLKYEPLDETKSEIRLLQIEPGGDHSAIQCTLQHVSCARVYPIYTALSYCWGDSKDTIAVTVNGCAVAVTRNLESALRALRSYRFDSRVGILVWVDALCINQHDKDERGHQVLRMRDIYSKAFRTVAWLGPDDGGYAEMAFECMRLLATEKPKTEFTEITENIKDKDRLRPDELPRVVAARVVAARVMINLPYWKRTWVIQELVLSGNLIFLWGTSTMDSYTFKLSIKTYRDFRPAAQVLDGWNEIKGIMLLMVGSNEGFGNGNGINLQSALSLTVLSRATDPRDKVSALRLFLCSFRLSRRLQGRDSASKHAFFP